MGYPGDEGIVPRFCRELFARIEHVAAVQEDWEERAADALAAGEAPPPEAAENLVVRVSCSMLEIYNGRVRDLFALKKKKGGGDVKADTGGLKVRMDPIKGPYAEGLTQKVCRSYANVDALMQRGLKARTMAATAMNETSSRAHTMFQLLITQAREDPARRGQKSYKASVVSLIDLAGSERQSKTEATGDRLKEATHINGSLSALGNVINALAEKSMKPDDPKVQAKLVPYRASTLTYLLQNSLGGDSYTIMIAAIAPGSVNYEETLSTLRYVSS